MVIRIEKLVKEFKLEDQKVRALSGISLEVERNEFVAVMGPSGSGKSTLLYLIGLLDRPTQGRYWFRGEEMTQASARVFVKIRREKIGFVFQDFNLIPRLSAFKNVELPLIYQGISLKDRKRRVREILDQVGLSHRLNHRPNELSGGEKQRVAIARAIVKNPSLILADEPTGNLDSKTGSEIVGLLQSLHRDLGATILMITHDQFVADSASRILRLKDGKIQS